MQNWKYIKIFPDVVPSAPTAAEITELLGVLSQFGEPGESLIPSGYTYFGQFIDHDLSFLLQNGSAPDSQTEPVDSDELTLARKPALDLDGVYGGGPSDSIIPFDKASGKFILGDTGFAKNRDFSRDPGFRPLIGDPRNDENLLVAQVQVLFMNVHNRIVQELMDDGWRNPRELFERAREEVIKIYQYLVLHDFAKTLVPLTVYKNVVLKGCGRLTSPSERDPTMALEVSDAALRLHALVRPTYRLNAPRTVEVESIINVAAGAAADGTLPPLLKAADEVDWQRFFAFANYGAPDIEQYAKQVSPVLTRSLRELRDDQGRTVDMLERNVLRGIKHGLCTGQLAIRVLMSTFSTVANDLGLRPLDCGSAFMLRRLSPSNSLRRHTPLWLYIMLEAADSAAGSQLGALGGWLLADTLRTAALSADVRLRDVGNPRPDELYRPLVAASGDRAAVTVEDVIVYTYGQPNRRDLDGKRVR